MITIPVGNNDTRIPFGIGIVQTAWKENILVKYGSAIGNIIRHRHRPTFINLGDNNYMYVSNPSKDVKVADRSSLDLNDSPSELFLAFNSVIS